MINLSVTFCKHLIAPTEGSSNCKGHMGKVLTTCETIPVSVNEFKSITEGDPLPDIGVNDLTSDQIYLFRIITAIKSGMITADLLQIRSHINVKMNEN